MKPSNIKRSESLKEYYKNNPRASKYANKRELLDSKKYFRLANRYGLSKSAYEHLLASQSGVCLICDNVAEVVDHDHETNNIRGMLCKNCNWGLGNFRDNPILLIRAAQYLQSESCHDLKHYDYNFDKNGEFYAKTK